MREIDFKLDVAGGKYTYVRYENGLQDALRHGEPWRDLCGDKFVGALASELHEAKERIAELEARYNMVMSLLDEYHHAKNLPD
ncbi:MAG: hypothetical protein LC687_04700, partial [Actinobacteria bacterium]|nr:hypothetical protein [Actinomycetota bacterium]